MLSNKFTALKADSLPALCRPRKLAMFLAPVYVWVVSTKDPLS